MLSSIVNIWCRPGRMLFGCLSLQYRRDFHKIAMVYKCRYGLAPQYLCYTFNANHDIHNHNIRNASLTVTKHAKGRTAYYHGRFAFSGQNVWYDLPNNINLYTSLSSFKMILVDNIFLTILIYMFSFILNVLTMQICIYRLTDVWLVYECLCHWK